MSKSKFMYCKLLLFMKVMIESECFLEHCFERIKFARNETFSHFKKRENKLTKL